MKISSADFQLNVERYENAAQHEPVTITKDGRSHTVLMSATLFETIVKGRIARRIEDVDDDTLDAIRNSAVPDEYAALDELLGDWKP